MAQNPCVEPAAKGTVANYPIKRTWVLQMRDSIFWFSLNFQKCQNVITSLLEILRINWWELYFFIYLNRRNYANTEKSKKDENKLNLFINVFKINL